MKRLLATLFFCATLAAMAVGQGYIAQHSMPIGEGPGVQGWGTVGPCGTGQAPVWQSGATSDPSCGSVATSPVTLPLSQSDIFVGSAANTAAAVPLSGDCTIVASGVITCLKTNGTSFSTLATQTTSLTNSQLLNSSITLNAGTGFGITAPGVMPLSGIPVTIGSTSDQLQFQGLGIGGVAPANGVKVYNVPASVSSNGQGAFGATALLGGVLQGNGSSNDLTFKNNINGNVCTVATGTTTLNCVGLQANGVSVITGTSPYIYGATIASPTIVSAFTATGLVTNADLTNASTTVNGTVCTLGSSCFFSNTASAVIVGTTAVQGGTNPDVLYNNNGTLGNLPVTGTTSVVLAGSPTIVNPTITSAFNATGLVTNADLANSSTTPNGVTCTLGSTCTLTASASSIQPGVTSVYSGVSGNVLFSDSTNTLSLYNTTGTSWVVLSAAPTITSPTIPGTGSTTAPLLIFSGCGVGCGIYAPGTNQLGITTNGLLRLDYNIINAFAWTANKAFVSNVASAPNFLLNAIGVNFGQLNNIDADTWALGYGPSVSINGTSAITWTDNGPITIAPSNFGLIVNSALSMAGSPPTNSGSCAVASQVGGNTAGTFVASGACAGGTYKLAFAYTAPHGWACDAEDRTTLTDTVRQNASTTSIATFTSTTASADVIQFKCMAY